MRRIDVDYRKWGGKQHYRWNGFLLGTDDHGTWIGTTKGSPATRPNGQVVPRGWGVVLLVPNDQWWSALYPEGGRYELYVDICAPSTWDGDRLEIVDLDLDVVRWRDGHTTLVDEDEFEDHQRAYAYPSEVIDSARTSADMVRKLVEDRAEPFGNAAQPWLSRLPT